jgi:predicted regulator of Ras-like GTPase activity (Roadblock/LC7/MglB family)
LFTSKGTSIIGKPSLAKATPPAPNLPPPSVPTATAESRPPLQLALNAVADGWPDGLKQEIIQLNLVQARLSIPYGIVEGGLKRGRLSFTWKQIKAWLTPPAAPGASVHDLAEVEFPLRVVAPLFIAQQKDKGRETTKVAVDKDIPNLFSGLPQPDTAGVAVDHSVSRPLDTNYYIWDDRDDMVAAEARADAASRAATAGTEFVTRYATPNEVVSRAASLDGVVGAVIALPDGLMVANQLPPGLNGDTLAAFLPHLFSKVTQCTQELRMGELNNLNFTVGNVPWKIFRVNALYFAAFGAKGEPLPTAKLAALAGELDHKAKA